MPPFALASPSRFRTRQAISIVVLAAILTASFASRLFACPFCPAQQPTWCELRDEADGVYLAEAISIEPLPLIGEATTFRLDQSLKGKKLDGSQNIIVPGKQVCAQGTLALLFKVDVASPWNAIPVGETAAAYFARAPDLRKAPTERLAYFAKYLEHDDPAIAADAIQEFGRADFAAVRAACGKLDRRSLLDWATSEDVAVERRGFYAMLLGLALHDDPAAPANFQSAARAALEKSAFALGDDFRAGYDGVLAGYVFAHGRAGVNTLREKLISPVAARPGDLRHALTALRFLHDEAPREWRGEIEAAVTAALKQPAVASVAIIDLGRWNVAAPLDEIVAWYARPDGDAAIRRAVVGYLLKRNDDAAHAKMAELRKLDPQGFEAAETALGKRVGRE